MTLRKTIRSRRLGKQLRLLRDTARMNQEDLVKAINAELPKQRRLSISGMSRIESGMARITPEQLALFAAALNAKPAKAKQLEALRAKADERGWWQDFADVTSEMLEMLIELDEDAQTIRSYDTTFVPGLLQTRQYAEAVVASGQAFVRPIDVDRLVELRVRRQQRLHDLDFGGLTAVMTEGVLRTQVGGKEVMRDQLRRLDEIASGRLPIAIHVLPFTAGALPSMDNVAIFSFPHEDDHDVVFVDSNTAARFHEEREPVRQCTFTFNAALARALPARQSQDLIREVMKEM